MAKAILRGAAASVATVATRLAVLVVICHFALASVILAEPVGDKVELPSPDDIQAGYRQNFTPITPMGVTYKLHQLEEIGRIEHDRKELWIQEQLMSKETQEDLAKQPAVVKDLISRAPKYRDQLLSRLSPEAIEKRLHKPYERHFYFWTDRNSLHIRFPKPKDDGSVQLQPGIVAPDNLPSLFPRVQMISWSKNNNPPLRFWLGCEKQSKEEGAPLVGGGQVADSVIEKVDSNVAFPPVGFTQAAWGRSYTWHDMDTFMSVSPKHCKVIGKEQLNGKMMLSMEVMPPTWSGDENTESFRRIRGLVDPSQGYLPVRLEEFDLDQSGRAVFRTSITEITEIKKLGQCYYPVRGKRQEFVPDASLELQDRKAGAESWRKQKAAGVKNPKMEPPKLPASYPPLPSFTKTWEVGGVIINQQLEASAVSLEFPVGTQYLDKVNDKWSRVGVPQHVYDEEVARERARELQAVEQQESKDSSSGLLRYMVVVNGVLAVLALIVSAVYYVCRKRKAGAS